MTSVEIGAVIQAGKAAFDTIRGLADAVSKSENAAEAVQITMAMADLGARVTEIQSAVIALARENQELRDKLELATKNSDLSLRMRFHAGVYWLFDSGCAEYEANPYCPLCFEKDKVLVHLQKLNGDKYMCELHSNYQAGEYDIKSRP